METVTLTKEELHEIVVDASREAAIKAITHFQSILSPKEEVIKVSKAYRVNEVAKLLGCSRSTVLRNYEKKECKLKRNKYGLFLGGSVKAEYERINGK